MRGELHCLYVFLYFSNFPQGSFTEREENIRMRNKFKVGPKLVLKGGVRLHFSLYTFSERSSPVLTSIKYHHTEMTLTPMSLAHIALLSF